jgi:hypothetical protein
VDLQAGHALTNEDLYRGFTPEKQAGYEAWLIERCGEGMRARLAEPSAYSSLPHARQQSLLMELRQLEQHLASALRSGMDPGCAAVDVLIRRHRAWVAAMWGRPCTLQSYARLADLYLSHPDFVARYERLEPGFTEYLARAMRLHTQKQAEPAAAAADCGAL